MFSTLCFTGNLFSADSCDLWSDYSPHRPVLSSYHDGAAVCRPSSSSSFLQLVKTLISRLMWQGNASDLLLLLSIVLRLACRRTMLDTWSTHNILPNQPGWQEDEDCFLPADAHCLVWCFLSESTRRCVLTSTCSFHKSALFFSRLWREHLVVQQRRTLRIIWPPLSKWECFSVSLFVCFRAQFSGP